MSNVIGSTIPVFEIKYCFSVHLIHPLKKDFVLKKSSNLASVLNLLFPFMIILLKSYKISYIFALKYCHPFQKLFMCRKSSNLVSFLNLLFAQYFAQLFHLVNKVLIFPFIWKEICMDQIWYWNNNTFIIKNGNIVKSIHCISDFTITLMTLSVENPVIWQVSWIFYFHFWFYCWNLIGSALFLR